MSSTVAVKAFAEGVTQQIKDYLPEDYQETAAQVMQEYRRERTDSFGFVPVPPVSTVRDGRQQKRYQIRINGYEVALREDGSLTRLARDGRSWADEAHPIGEFLYEVFSPEDFRRFEEQYITAMINKVVDHGPFIHIGKGIALPHARPEDGVNAIGMSLLKVKEPVLLNDDPQHPIHVFICLAAVDNELHLKALASLTKILSNNEKLTALLSATNADQIIEVIREGEDEK